ncbi:polysaccharide deacetylase family protein [Streptomyces sp. CAU 1734]|uniref:polysaccharide deacetylase family protein n=1 Tax=Streptomyces sp. CAU 1734 TaxID=3140360 RepID=UPI003261BB56
MPEIRRKTRLGAAVAGASALTLTLGACTLETTAPADARSDARENGKSLAADQNPRRTTGAQSAVVGTEPVDCEKAKCIAMTFDGGPGKDTPKLLDTLKKEKVPVTFFLLGKKHIVKYPQVVKRLSDEGHEVANHTWTHKRLDTLTRDEIRRELLLTQNALEKLTGKKPGLMRPPQGRINDDVTAVSKELGLAQILWSATAKDFSTNDSALIRKRILKQSSRDGIILLHDIYDGTVPAVPGIITELKKRGYTFVTVSQLLAPAKANPGEIYRP